MDKNLKSLTLRQLSELGEKHYNGIQIFRWIWKKGETNIEKFTDISKNLRKKLISDGFYVGEIEEKLRISSKDRSIKFVFEDGYESVYIPEVDRATVCVSSQLGCALKCNFCATGLLGFRRNLKFWEIADQVLQVSKKLNSKITNVVFMGMGEPLLNFENVKQAIRIMTSHIGLNLGARHITVSTSGIVPKIYELANFERRVKLAISLHSAIEDKRNIIMPISRSYSLIDLKNALVYYLQKQRRRITIEYIILKGFNDKDEDIKALKKFIQGLDCKLNLIPYNKVDYFHWDVPSQEDVYEFYDKLKKELDIVITIRWSRGSDVYAACGQLGSCFINKAK
ncbi:MAG: 23S rRNA (adenine(2503)-C(2))-methyltransferase RlmN [candidate division WOR-3 bacterium]